MPDLRATVREQVLALAAALSAGDAPAVAAACADDVRWWTPVTDDVSGAQAAAAALTDLVRRAGGHAALASVAVDADGAAAVLELVAGADRSVPVTFVLRLAGGRVVSGRVYVDVEQLAEVPA